VIGHDGGHDGMGRSPADWAARLSGVFVLGLNDPAVTTAMARTAIVIESFFMWFVFFLPMSPAATC
jgi:hypothetical protein